MYWQELRSPEIGALSRNTVVVLPVAAVEQHGPHLPTGTDSMIAESIAARLDEACGRRLLVTPVQRIGISEHHMKFAGTLTLTHESFKLATMDIIRSVARQGFRRVLVLNAHGGNQSVCGVICEKAPYEFPEAEVMYTSWWRLAADRLKPLVEGDFPAVGHACEFETSMILALHPKLVDMSAAKDDGLPPRAPQLKGDMLSGAAATFMPPFHELTKHGVYGRPTKASAEKGERLLREITASLKEFVEAVWEKRN
jgi:creatinine amidohydrolase